MPAPDLRLAALAPIGFAAIGAVCVLLGEVLLSRRRQFLGRPISEAWVGTMLAFITALFLILAVAAAGQGFLFGSSEVFHLGNPMLRLDHFSNFAILLIGVASLLATGLSITYLAELRINHGEYYALLLLATAGMFLLVSAIDFMAVFLGLELMSLPIYALAGFDRRKLRSNESALKYFLIGSFASALLLYGVALLYGATGHTDFEGLQRVLDFENPLALIGCALVFAGFAFKIAAVPFHAWAPDVYEGAPTSVTAYMSVAVKVAAFAALLRFLRGALGDLEPEFVHVVWVLAVLTMLVGNVMAVIQQNVKRLLAYSSIAHAGYLLIGVVTGTQESYAGILFYLAVYVFMNTGAFGVMIALAHQGRDCENIDDFAGLARTRPGLAVLMTLFLVALAGIPGTAGFVAKFMLFAPAVKEGHVVLAVIAVLTSLVSVYYYLRVPVAMWMRDPSETAAPRFDLSTSEFVVLSLCAALVLALGLFPNHDPFFETLRFLDMARQSAAYLF